MRIILNEIPTMETVEYDRIYYFDNPEIVFDKFTFAEGNRDFKKVTKTGKESYDAIIKDVTKQILEGEFGSTYIAPIRVDIKTLEVEDGQHRYIAFLNAWAKGSNAKMKVIFENFPVDPKKKLKVISDIQNQKAWTIKDFAHLNMTLNDENTLKFNNFAITHTMCMNKNKNSINNRYTCAFLFGTDKTNKIIKNELIVTDEILEEAHKLYEEVEKLAQIVNKEQSTWFEGFVKAWYDVRHTECFNTMIYEVGFNTILEEFTKHINENGSNLYTKKIDWLKLFDNIINTTRANMVHSA